MILEISKNLFLLPTKKKQSGLNTYSETQLLKEPFIFENPLGEIKKLDFDGVIFDLSPSISQLEH